MMAQDFSTLDCTKVDDFDILKPLSRGAFGTIFLCRKKHKNSPIYAMKVMRKKDAIDKNKLVNIYGEREILSSVACPFIVSLLYFLQSDNYVYFVMEYMIGGDLKNMILSLQSFHEYMSAFYIAEAAIAIDYLHQHNIIHRDIKPDNMLISRYGHLKLTDFGLSRTARFRRMAVADEIFTPNGKKKQRRTPGLKRSFSSGIHFNKVSDTDSYEESLLFKDGATHLIGSAPDYVYLSPDSTPKRRKLNDAGVDTLKQGVMLSRSLNDDCSVLEHDFSLSSKDSGSFENGVVEKRAVGEFCSNIKYASRAPSRANVFCGKENIVHWENQGHFAALPSFDFENKKNLDNINFATRVGSVISNRKPFAEYSNRLNTIASEARNENLITNFSIDLSRRLSTMSFEDGMENNDDNELLAYEHNATGTLYLPLKSMSEDVPNLPAQEKYMYNLKDKRDQYLREVDKFVKSTKEEIFLEISEIGEEKNKFMLRKVKLKSEFQHRKSAFSVDTTLMEKHGRSAGIPDLKGTPDYFAPEILQCRHHSKAVDWWALGCCLFEFTYGCPPFWDTTVAAIFDNIMNYRLELDDEAPRYVAHAIKRLLAINPHQRADLSELKQLAMFKSIDFDNILSMQPPYIPEPIDETDVSNFTAVNEIRKFPSEDIKRKQCV